MVTREGQSRQQRQWSAPPFPEAEPTFKTGSEDVGDVEFSLLDPEIGAILAEVTPAVYTIVAARIAESEVGAS